MGGVEKGVMMGPDFEGAIYLLDDFFSNLLLVFHPYLEETK